MMMQFEKRPELILGFILFLSKVWDWIKIYVNFTNNGDGSHQIESQLRASSRDSEDCDTKDNESPTPRHDGDHSHLLGEEACHDNDHHCDDEEEEDESYFFSDSDSEAGFAPNSCCDNDCEDHKENRCRWEDTWAASPSGFSDVKCQQQETLFDHFKHFPQNGQRHNNFASENVFQKQEIKYEKKPPIEGWFDSHLNDIWVSFLQRHHMDVPHLVSAPHLDPLPPDPPLDPLTPETPPRPPEVFYPAIAEIPAKGCMNHSPNNLSTPHSMATNLGKVGHSGGNRHGTGGGRGRGGGGTGGGGGGRGGGSGGGGGGGGGGPPPNGNPQGQGQKVTLTIKTSPQMWGVRDVNHSKNNCTDKFLETLFELFQFIEQDWDDEFSWLNGQGQLNGASDDRSSDIYKVTQFIAMMVVWIGREDIPGSHNAHDQTDLFTYRDDGFLDTNEEGFSVSAILFGIDFESPENRFSPLGHLGDRPAELDLVLRPALVHLHHLLHDMRQQDLKIQVEYTYHVNDQDKLVTFSDEMVESRIEPAVHRVALMFHSVFKTQHAAQLLGVSLSKIDDNEVRNLEEQVCNFSLSPDGVNISQLKADLAAKLNYANNVIRDYDAYEKAARATSDGLRLCNAQVQQTFSDYDMVIQFMRNNSDNTMPYIEQARKHCTTVVQTKLGNTRLQVTSNPSRLHLPRSVTCVDQQVAGVKEFVNQGIKVILQRERQGDAGGGAEGGGPRPRVPQPEAHLGSSVSYPHQLLQDACELNTELSGFPDLEGQSVHVLQDLLDRVVVCTKEVQKVKWQGVTLSSVHEEVLKNLNLFRPTLTSIISEHKQEDRNEEARQREMAKNISMSKPPQLDDQGTNIVEYLQFHSVFSSASPLARAIKLRSGLSKTLQARTSNITDPEAIIKVLSDLFLQQDVLIPKSLMPIRQLRSGPACNSAMEAEAYSTINCFISKLRAQNLLHKLDYTTMQICLSKLSRQRLDDFERNWIYEQNRVKHLPDSEQEDKKRDVFLEFIYVNEQLIHRRLLQNTMQDKDSKDKYTKDKVFSTQIRQTKYDKKQNKGKSDGAQASQIVCPFPQCKKVGGHPKEGGLGAKSLGRCPVLRGTPSADRLALIKSVKGCSRCLNHGHELSGCRLDPNKEWLQKGHGDGCGETNGQHHPSVCPKGKRFERANTTREEGNGGIVTINLSERGIIKDQAGKSHQVLILWDTAADSCWVSSKLAKSFPSRKKKRVTLNLSTIPSQRPFSTFEHSICIQVGKQLKKLQCYESPSIGELHKDDGIDAFLKEHIELPVDMVGGEVQLIVGLKSMGIHPISTHISPPPGAPDLRIYQSKLVPTRHIAGGSIPRSAMKTLSFQTSSFVNSALYTKSELMSSILSDNELDILPTPCTLCQEKSKTCPSCKLAASPLSLSELKEVEMIRRNMCYDKVNRKVSTIYEPLFSSFSEIFPKHLSNANAALKIAKRMRESLKKSDELKEYNDAFQEMIEKGIIEEVSSETLKSWEEQELGVNFISTFFTRKQQTSDAKIKTRIVTNSSLARPSYIEGKIVNTSLNNLLPQGSPKLNNIVDILLRWITSPVSLTTDLRSAFTNIHPTPGRDGETMKSVRRLWWFKDPFQDNPSPTMYCLGRLHYGDASSSGCLQELVNKVASDIKEVKNNEEHSLLYSEGSYVDDTLAGCSSVHQAFSLFKDIESSFDQYNVPLHPPAITSKEGKHDTPDGEPRTSPIEGESVENKLLGMVHNELQDSLRIEINKNINKRKKGLRCGESLTPETAMKLEVTQRKLIAFQMSQYDPLGLQSPILVRGKCLCQKVQQVLTPALKESWDAELPEELLAECRDYIAKVVGSKELVFPRYSPPGSLKQLMVHHDGSSQCFATIVYAIFIEQDGTKHSKLIYCKPRVCNRTVPEIEFQSLFQATEICQSLVRIFPLVEEINICGDSESSLKKVASLKPASDVFTKNRLRRIISNVKALNDNNVNVFLHQVASVDNQADRATKYIPGSERYIHSEHWLCGAPWFCQPKERWPIVKTYVLGNSVMVERNFFTNTDMVETPQDNGCPPPNQRSVGSQEGDEHDKDDHDVDDHGDHNDDDHHDGDDHDGESGSKGDGGEDVGDKLNKDTPWDGGDKFHHCDGHFEKESIFDSLLVNVSNIRIAARAVGRIKNALRMKTFKGINRNLSEEEERCAFIDICRDQQKKTSKQICDPKVNQGATFVENQIVWSSQRWNSTVHSDIFGADRLPVVLGDTRLATLLLHRGHRGKTGPCCSDEHAKSRVRTGAFQAYILGPERRYLRTIRRNCPICRKLALESKQGLKRLNFQPKMKNDSFKTLDPSLPVYSHCSLDTVGPVLTTNSPKAKNLRSNAKFVKCHILIICDLTGVGAVKFRQISSTSSAAVVQALHYHIAESGIPPRICYMDSASSFCSIASKQKGGGEDEQDDDSIELSLSSIQDCFPNTTFKVAGSSAQFKNASSERSAFFAKRYLKSTLGLKPACSLPRFTHQGLDLVLREMENHANNRPVCFLRSSATYLTANHFLRPTINSAVWNENLTLEEKYLELQDYRSRMRKELVEACKATNFISGKWKTDGLMPKEGDFVLVSRGRNKVAGLGRIEYALIQKVSDDGRTLEIRVCRSEKDLNAKKNPIVKEITCDSRNCFLIFRSTC